MAGRWYTATSNLVSYGTTTTTPILAGSATSSAPFDIACIRVGIHSGGAAPTYPSNASVLVQLARTTGAIGGGSSITARIAPHNTTDIASNAGYLYDASSGSISGLTQGVNLWQTTLPFAAGQPFVEWVNPGAEWRISASTTFALFVTASASGTSTDIEAELVWVE